MTVITHTESPVTLTGDLDPRLSRWLWLVKMFLAIPHFIVLAALGIPFIVTSLVAGAAILFTGRYPHALFEFNVGVLRWNWRVGFYVYAALGTDKYPPFSFARQADYPAEFEVEYPERLSRALVLVKWPLALPHLLIVGFIMGDLLFFHQATDAAATATFSILNVLVVIAGALLLITARYPQQLFDLLIGLNRWIYRVLAYVAFMRDEYPPFRLDAGARVAPIERAHP